ncbi:MAG: hypothetical protein WAU60_10000 [Candidatus Competibacter denitrificans]|jgi:antitoxin VapB
MKETIAQRQAAETPLETAARIRKKYDVSLSDVVRKPLPKQAFDAMWDDHLGRDDRQLYQSNDL